MHYVFEGMVQCVHTVCRAYMCSELLGNALVKQNTHMHACMPDVSKHTIILEATHCMHIAH